MEKLLVLPQFTSSLVQMRRLWVLQFNTEVFRIDPVCGVRHDSKWPPPHTQTPKLFVESVWVLNVSIPVVCLFTLQLLVWFQSGDIKSYKGWSFTLFGSPGISELRFQATLNNGIIPCAMHFMWASSFIFPQKYFSPRWYRKEVDEEEKRLLHTTE